MRCRSCRRDMKRGDPSCARRRTWRVDCLLLSDAWSAHLLALPHAPMLAQREATHTRLPTRPDDQHPMRETYASSNPFPTDRRPTSGFGCRFERSHPPNECQATRRSRPMTRFPTPKVRNRQVATRTGLIGSSGRRGLAPLFCGIRATRSSLRACWRCRDLCSRGQIQELGKPARMRSERAAESDAL